LINYEDRNIRPAFRPGVARWQTWPPRRALEIEQREPEFDEGARPANAPRSVVGSDIDPQFPVFGNPLTSTVRENFAIAKHEIEELQRRIADAEEFPDAPLTAGPWAREAGAWVDMAIIDCGTY